MNNFFKENQNFKNSIRLNSFNDIYEFFMLGSIFVVIPALIIEGVILVYVFSEYEYRQWTGRFIQFFTTTIASVIVSIASWQIIINRSNHIEIYNVVTDQFTQISGYIYMNSLGSNYKNHYIENAICYNYSGSGLQCALTKDLFERTESYDTIYAQMIKWFNDNDKFDIYFIFGSMGIIILLNNIIFPIVVYIIDQYVFMEIEQEINNNKKKAVESRRKLKTIINENIYESASIETGDTSDAEIEFIETVL